MVNAEMRSPMHAILRRSLVFFCLALAVAAAGATSASAATLLHVSANRIAFYYDRFQVEGDGHVRVTTSDGFSVTGDAFSMDLKLNRFLVAGHVTLTAPNGTSVHGAAISDFLDFKRIYFVPITSEPDRWTFLNGDLAHPVKGRIMPGDVFDFPQGLGKPSLTAHGAVIQARSYVRFADCETYLAGIPFPLKSFYVNFGSDTVSRYLAQNSLTGANADATWNFAGNANSVSALHLRYDPTNHLFAAFEQHVAGAHEYAVFSVNPMTKIDKFYNLQLYDQIGSRFQIQTFTQMYAVQHLFEEPLAATQTTYVNATQAFWHSFLFASGAFTDYNLLGPKRNTLVPQGGYNHPTQLQLTYQSFPDRIGKSPFYFKYRFGWGLNHDSVGQPATPGAPSGLQNFGGVNYTTIYNNVYGLTLYTSQIKLGNQYNPYKTYYINGYFDKQSQHNSLPHHIESTTTLLSLSRQFSRSLNAYLTYGITNTGDYYKVGGYPAYTPIINGVPVTSFRSFRGVATQRTLTLGGSWNPSPEFQFNVIARKHDDFPIPYPGLFPLPQTNVLGQYLYANFLGQPPYDITGEVRAQLFPHAVLDVQRTYYFNFGTLRWSPSFIVQVLSQ